ncbi:MAG: CotH kinase family protein [Eubacteriales bacterium]
MLKHKNIDKICCIALAICILITVLFMNGEQLGISSYAIYSAYQEKLFATPTVHEINIMVNEDDWNTLLENPSNKEYISCNIQINNDLITNVAIRTKGNSSLSMVASSTSDRYSFKIEFDHYDNTNLFYGLDKLCLNNIIQDTTYMKDYLAYSMMNDFGIPSPLCNYANVSINGVESGLYLAVEAIEESFLQRNYGNNYGNAYKPETEGNMAGGDNKGGDQQGQIPAGMQGGIPADFDISMVFDADGTILPQVQEALSRMPTEMLEMLLQELPDESKTLIEELLENQAAEMPQQGESPMQGNMQQQGESPMQGNMQQQGESPMQGNMQQQGESPRQEGMPQQNAGGGNDRNATGSTSNALGYIDDNVESYSYFFNNAVTNPSNKDKEKVITALENLTNNSNLESAIDTEQVLRYFVVHNYLLNFDSYTGSIMHNYYVYEENGILSMLPWDYNLSFASFMVNYDTESLVNFPIDTPISTGTLETRPMLSWIFETEEYTARYHELFYEFLELQYESGYLEDRINTISELIAPYVEKDPTKFYTYDQFTKGVSTLIEFNNLRSQSILGQLNGTIGSTTDTQSNRENFIQTDHLEITDTGSTNMNIGGGTQNRPR